MFNFLSGPPRYSVHVWLLEREEEREREREREKERREEENGGLEREEVPKLICVR